MMFEHKLLERARADKRRVVLPEGTEERVLRAAEVLLRRGVCDLTLLGPVDGIRKKAADLGIDLGGCPARSTRRPPNCGTAFAEKYAKLRAHKGVTVELAYDVVSDVNYFGTLMVQEGLADGMVSGSVHSTAATIRPAFEIIKTKPDAVDRLLGLLHVPGRQGPRLRRLRGQPGPERRAVGRHRHPVGRDRRAVRRRRRGSRCCRTRRARRARARTSTRCARPRSWSARSRPDLRIEGPIQYDAAVEPTVAATKLPGSEVAGQATVLIFPDLNTGNNTYKAVQRSAGAIAVGPVLQGLRKPVNDLSRGALVPDIVTTVAITAIQAQSEATAIATSAPTEKGLRAVTATRVLVLNSGSSSVKYQLLDMRDSSRLAVGLVERIGEETSRLKHTPLATGGESRERTGPIADHEAALKAVAEELAKDGLGLDSPELAAIGHRVVHGGLSFTEPTVIDDAVLAGDRAPDPGGPAAQPGEPHRHPYGPGPAPRPPAGRGLRHGLPHHDAGVRGPLRDRREDRRRAPHPAVRLPRHLARVRVPGDGASCWAGRPRT